MEQSSDFFVSLRARPTYSDRSSCVCAAGRPQGFSAKAEYLIAGAGGGAVRGGPLTEARDRDGPANSDKGGAPRKPQRDVGDLLKSAYNETVHEDIPPEFLDLLGKLD